MLIIIIPGIFTNHKFIQVILNNRLTNLLANLTFSIYLIHPMVNYYILYNRRSDISFTDGNAFLLSIEIFLLTVPIAFVVHILVEKSFIKLESI